MAGARLRTRWGGDGGHGVRRLEQCAWPALVPKNDAVKLMLAMAAALEGSSGASDHAEDAPSRRRGWKPAIAY
jgi:hypothetical protein